MPNDNQGSLPAPVVVRYGGCGNTCGLIRRGARRLPGQYAG